jgi:hypothetical protein
LASTQESLVQPTEPASKPPVREARLRAEFAPQYSGIEPDVWFNAALLAEQLIAKLLRDGVPDDELPRRVLDPQHFEFRDAEPVPSSGTSHSAHVVNPA